MESDDNPIPTSFASIDEMMAFVEGQTKKTSTKKKSRGTKNPPTPRDEDTSVRIGSNKLDMDPKLVYKVIHYYTRPNDTFSAAKQEASREALYHNINVRTLVHDHDYDSKCLGNVGKCVFILGEKEG